MLSSGGLENVLKRVNLIFIFVKPGSDPNFKDIEVKRNQDHFYANKGK